MGSLFKKQGDGPILSSSLHEPFLVGDSFVCKFNEGFHMWYIYGTRWTTQKEESPARVYKIGYASSNDGLNWEKEGKPIIADKLNEDECQALPSVIFHRNKYHMFFCYRQATGFRKDKTRGYRIGYASSTDMRNWNRNDVEAGINVGEEGWDSDMMCYPHIFACSGKIYLLYNGNEFGRYGFGAAVLEE